LGFTVAALKARYARSWQFTARAKQLPPEGDWTFWLLMAGRGFGKTLSGAQWAAERGREGRRRIAVVAPTLGDARAVL
jgi:phage terminase large subunit-like protein